MKNKVLILLSVYNGARYLEQQLVSIAKQKERASLLVRDDGSTDGSLDLLLRICDDLSIEVFFMRGSNVGAAASFFTLMKEALNYQYEYFAFCDQDDYWLPEKLNRAVNALGPSGNSPTLYCSRQLYADAELRIIGKSKLPKKVGFGNALVENIAVGCTTVINRSALKILSACTPASCIMHDWWAYLSICAVQYGKVIYDDVPSILYRQHGANTVGVGIGFFNTLRRRLRHHFSKKKPSKYTQAKEFARQFRDELSINERYVLNLFLESEKCMASRFRLGCSKQIWRQSSFDTLVFRVLALTGRL